MAWNTVHDNTTAWASVAFLQTYLTAINERWRAAHDSGSDFDSYLTPNTGYVASKVSALGPDDADGPYSVRWLQASVEALFTGSLSFDGWAAYRRWNGAAYVTATNGDGLAAKLPVWAFNATPSATASSVRGAVLNAAGWTRKYPREFAGPTATAYNDGSAFADGHKARFVDDGRVYARTAGAWVAAAATAAPDAVTAYGSHAVGDYVGPWVWNELRDVLNLMVDIAHRNIPGEVQTVAPGAGVARRFVQVDFQASAAAARAAAEADWPANTAGLAGYTEAHFSVLGESGGTYFARLVGGGWVVTTGTQQRYAKTVDFYVQVDTPDAFVGAPPAGFDANGDDVLDGLFSLFDSQALAAAVTAATSVPPADLSVVPAWPADPAAGETLALGWSTLGGAVGDYYAIERLTGFAYGP